MIASVLHGPDFPASSGSGSLLVAAEAEAGERLTVKFVEGREQVLSLADTLIEFSDRCGQFGSMHDLAYFLAKPGAFPRVPYLLLVGRDDLDPVRPDLDHLLGCVLIFQQRLFGVRTGAFATNDRSGRNTLIARPLDRSRVAGLASRALLDRGARLILMSFRAAQDSEMGEERQPRLLEVEAHGLTVAKWSTRERTVPGYLPLSATLEATLAHVGTRTRRNLRYYRRRAESELGCVFLPQIEATRDEVLAFSRECMYPVPAKVVMWRYDSLQELSGPIFMGMKDKNNQWLSMLGGRRYLDRSEILWQLNRDGLAPYSLSTAMRSYFIEHEIEMGSRRLYTEGGTPHSMRFSFVPESLTDLVVVRQTLAAMLMQIAARRHIAGDNDLSHMLSPLGQQWQRC